MNKIICLTILLLLSMPVQAQELIYAGVTLLGDYKNNAARYPIAAKLMHEKKNGVDVLNSALNEALKTLTRKDLMLMKGVQNTTSLTLSFALMSESVERDRVGSKYLSVYRVMAEIFIFDMEEKKIVSNFPIMVQYHDLTSKLNTEKDDEIIFRKIYLDHTFKLNIFSEWVKRLDVLPIKSSYQSYLQIQDIKVAEENYKHMPNSISKSSYTKQVAQTFEMLLASTQGVSMLPYTKGQAIGRSMAMRFPNGDIYNLKWPDADFIINLEIRPFKHVKKVTDGYRRDYYGAFITLKLEQPDMNKIYMSSKFKNINVISANVASIDIWYAYQNSLTRLFSKLTIQISERDRNELKKMTRAKNIIKELKIFQEVLNKCS